MKKVTDTDRRNAEQRVEQFTEWSALGHNTKYMEDWKTIQMRIGDTLRVQFTVEEGEKEITDIFHKTNHTSHR